jgi:hypothetical protein
VDLFANVNGKIVSEEPISTEISGIFREATQRLAQIEKLMKEIRVISIKTYQILSLSQRTNNLSQSSPFKKKEEP